MLNKLAAECHKMAKSKGFHDNPLPIPSILMLIVSELSEAMEADRTGKHANIDLFLEGQKPYGNNFVESFELNVKDTIEDEIADTFIRLLDLCGNYGIDIDNHISLKMHYNSLRENKHGKRY